MNYWKIITYAEGSEGEYDTRERIVDDATHQKIREALAQGADLIDLGEKGIIRRSSIKEILEANNIVKTYQAQGLKIDGLLEPVSQPRITGGVRSIKDHIVETHSEFYAKMGWAHKEDCSCKDKVVVK